MLKDPVETTGHEKPEAENECRGFTIFHKVANNDHKVAVKNQKAKDMLPRITEPQLNMTYERKCKCKMYCSQKICPKW